MLFSKLHLRRRSSTKPASPPTISPAQLSHATQPTSTFPDEAETLHPTGLETNSKTPTESMTRLTTQESKDYEEFLERARKEEEKKAEELQKELLRGVREADRRRRMMDLDGWARRFWSSEDGLSYERNEHPGDYVSKHIGCNQSMVTIPNWSSGRTKPGGVVLLWSSGKD